MKNILLIYLLGLLFAVPGAGQGRKTVDSLMHIINTTNPPLDRQIGMYDTICLNLMLDMEERIFYGKKGLSVAMEANDKVMISRFCNLIAGGYDPLAEYDSALFYFNMALDYGIQAKNTDRQLAALINIANSYNRQSKYTLALQYYIEMIPLNESTGNWSRHVAILGNIAEIYLELKNIDRAIYYIEEADRISKIFGFNHLTLQSDYVWGCIYKEKGDYEKALEHQFKSVEISKISYITYASYSMQSIAQIYLELKDYEKAQKYTYECLSFAERLSDPKLCARGWALLSDISYKQKDYKNCEAFALKALEYDSLSLDVGPGLAINITLANIHLGNDEKADAYLERYNELKNQYIDKNFRETMLDMEVKYETERKEMRITALEKQKRLSIWLGIVAITALLLALGLLLARHRMNLHKRMVAEQEREIAEQQVKQLEQEKRLIATQAVLDGEAAERSRMARDLHDGLGGMLSVIRLHLNEVENNCSSNTSIHNHSKKACELLDQSITELRRVAHHMMPESLMRYGLKISLEDFCLSIPGAHFQYYGEDHRLDSRLEVLIYRCAFELVNNALKHANAQNIYVQLMVDNGIISLSVNDDGIGFDPSYAGDGSGLENIRTRVSTYNGKMYIHSSPNHGTEINIEIEGVA